MEDVKPQRNLWKPGQSGNAAGKPKGAKNRTTIIKRAIEEGLIDSLESQAQGVLAKALSMAKEGDQQMIKLILDKLLPNARGDGLSVGSLGSGGIHITIGSTEKPTIDATIIQEEDEDERDEQQE